MKYYPQPPSIQYRNVSLIDRLSCTDFWGLMWWWWWCWWFLMSWIWNLETKVWILALPFSSVCPWLLSQLVSLNLNFFSYKNGGCFKQYGTWIFESTLHIVNACYDAYFLKVTKKILLQCICVIWGATTVLRFHCFLPLADSHFIHFLDHKYGCLLWARCSSRD